MRHWPPRPDQPLDDGRARKFAHSLRLVLPRSTAPASRSARATVESRAGTDPSSASEPAVVVMRSAVSMLSLSRIGMPWSGPRTRPALAFLIESAGDRQRVGVDLEHAGDPGVERLDPLEIELGGSERGELAALEAPPELGDADLEQLEVAAGHAGRLRRGSTARVRPTVPARSRRARAGARHQCRAAQRAEMEEAPSVGTRSCAHRRAPLLPSIRLARGGCCAAARTCGSDSR